jgi:hypothetical protein
MLSFTLDDLLSGSDDNPRPRKVVIYGTHGIGKSTFAAQCPYGPVVFLPTEDGYQDLRPKVKVLTFNKKKVLETESELNNAINLLLSNSSTHGFGTVVLDSAEAAAKLFEAKIVEDANNSKIKTIADIGFGKGQAAAAGKFDFLLSGLDALSDSGLFVIVIAHADVERFNDPAGDPYDRYTLRLDKRVSPRLQEWADEVLFANYKTYTRTVEEGFGKKTVKATGTGERVLYTTERPPHDAKNRLRLPDEMSFDWLRYQQAVSEGVESVPGEMV